MVDIPDILEIIEFLTCHGAQNRHVNGALLSYIGRNKIMRSLSKSCPGFDINSTGNRYVASNTHIVALSFFG